MFSLGLGFGVWMVITDVPKLEHAIPTYHAPQEETIRFQTFPDLLQYPYCYIQYPTQSKPRPSR